MNFVRSVLDTLGDEVDMYQHVSDIMLWSKYQQLSKPGYIDVVEIELRKHY